MSEGATLLIVDDKPENLRLMSEYLAEQGFELMLTRSGAQALQKIPLSAPDLILLDLRMPGMDGFEVCRRLKADAATAHIPVIFMTAEDEIAQKVTGFALGAVDYITKPIQREELVARIQNQLQLHRLQKALYHQTRELAARNAELEAYARTIAHSLKTPLAASARFLEILSKYKSHNLDAGQRQLLEQSLDLISGTGSAIDALLTLSRVTQQEVTLEPLDIASIVDHVLARLTHARTGAVIELPPSWPGALGYAPWVAEIWTNLLSNALKYGGVPARIALGARLDGAQVRFWVRDNGTALSDEACQRIFTPFTRLQQERAEGHGLGLVTVDRIVRKLGGSVRAQAIGDSGNEFSFTLPPVEPA